MLRCGLIQLCFMDTKVLYLLSTQEYLINLEDTGEELYFFPYFKCLLTYLLLTNMPN